MKQFVIRKPRVAAAFWLFSLGFLSLLLTPSAKALQTVTVASDFRTWTDRTGVFTVEARMLSFNRGNVKLEKKDGLIVELPLSKLNSDDQFFVIQQMAKAVNPSNPFAGGVPAAAKNPFEEAAGKSSSTKPDKPSVPGKKVAPGKLAAALAAAKTSDESPSTSLAEKTSDPKTSVPESSVPKAVVFKIDVSKNVTQLVDADWQLHGGTAVEKTTKLPSHIFAYPESVKRAVHDRRQPPIMSHDGKLIAVSAFNPFDDNTMVKIFDSQTGAEVGGEFIEIEDLNVFAIDSENRQLLTFQKGSTRRSGKIEFRSFDQLAHPTAVWETGSDFGQNGMSPKFGQFVGDGKFLTFGRRITLWDVNQPEAIYSIKPKSFSLERSAVTFSPDGEYIAVGDRDAICFIEVATGKSLGMIKSRAYKRSLSISPSGDFLSLLNSRGEVTIWDLASQEIAQSFSTGGRYMLHWVDDRHLIVDSKYLFDVEYRVCVWEYSGAGSDGLTRLGDGHFLLKQESKLLPIKLPHENFSDRVDELDPDSLLILQPGDEIAIDYDLPFDEVTQTKIRKRLEQQLAAAGVSINSQSNIVLKGRVSTGKERTSQINNTLGFGFGFGRQRARPETVTYTPHRSSIQIIKGGQTVHRRSIYHGPVGALNTKEGESNQEYVERISTPTPSLFLQFRVPIDQAVLPGGKPFGKSNLSQARVKTN